MPRSAPHRVTAPSTRRDALATYPILRCPRTRVCVRGGDVSGGGGGGGTSFSAPLARRYAHAPAGCAYTRYSRCLPSHSPDDGGGDATRRRRCDAMRCPSRIHAWYLVSPRLYTRISANNAVASPLLVSFSSRDLFARAYLFIKERFARERKREGGQRVTGSAKRTTHRLLARCRDHSMLALLRAT